MFILVQHAIFIQNWESTIKIRLKIMRSCSIATHWHLVSLLFQYLCVPLSARCFKSGGQKICGYLHLVVMDAHDSDTLQHYSSSGLSQEEADNSG